MEGLMHFHQRPGGRVYIPQSHFFDLGWGLGVAPATPFVHGQPFTITGSGFGSKPTAAPLKWEDFESGVSGNALTGWTSTDGVYTTTRLRTGSSMSAKVPMLGDPLLGGNAANSVALNFPASTTKVFISFWCNVDVSIPTLSNGGWKMLDLRMNGGENERMLIQGNADPNGDGNPSDTTAQAAVDNGDPISYPSEPINTMDIGELGGFFIFKDNWVLVQTAVEMDSALDAGDGYWRIWFNGSTRRDSRAANPFTKWYIRKTGGGANNGTFQDILIGQFKSTNTDVIPYLDDIYIDTTWARVELGNNAVYESCTLRAMQPPTNWASNGTSITVTGNKGGLPSGANFLYVFNTAGTQVGMFPVTVT